MTAATSGDPRLMAMGLLIEVHGGLTAKMEGVFAAHGLSGNEFDTLIRLDRASGAELRMSDLAAQSGLSTSGMTRIVDRLEGEGLVCRNACPGDRRSSLAVLTEPGRQRLEALLPELLEAIERCFTGALAPGQLDGLLASLRLVRAVVRSDSETDVDG